VILLVDKPAGLTSHDVVARVRRALRTRKVGHAGTLDPMATGLLVLGVGRATRLLGHLGGHDKVYEATIRLGSATTTDDREGEPLPPVADRVDPRALPASAVAAAMSAFVGTIDQVPSAVSAIKVDGVRSYTRVRAGEAVALPARQVTVSAFDLLARRDAAGGAVPQPGQSGPAPSDQVPSDQPAPDRSPSDLAAAESDALDSDAIDLDVRVACSAGTYVRALARDLGAALHTGGHLTALRRTQSRPWHVDQAVALADVADGAGRLTPAEAVAAAFPRVDVSADVAADLRHGRWAPAAGLAGTYGVHCPTEAPERTGVVAVAHDVDDRMRTLLVLESA
jgi:tRNA pseudouridine55 synthase